MKKIAALSAFALLAVSGEANAQILGGLGGSVRAIPSLPSVPTLPRVPTLPAVPVVNVGSAATGAITVNGAVSKSIDLRQGKASASGSAGGSASGNSSNAASAGGSSLAGALAGSAQAQLSGSADAQLVGTDAVHGLVVAAKDNASATAAAAGNKAGTIVQTLESKAGSLIASGTAATGSAMAGANGTSAGNGSAAGQGGSLGLGAGLALAANAAGDLVIKPGTTVFDTAGERIGKVRQIVTDARGTVTGILVKAGDATALLPASNFAADGSLLVSAMGEAQIESIAASQEPASDNAASGSQ